MSNLKLSALAGACALLGASSLAATSAHAATQISGGGSSLLAPFWVQAANCYDTDNTTYFIAGAPVTGPRRVPGPFQDAGGLSLCFCTVTPACLPGTLARTAFCACRF
jgi:hypothetical protein